MALVMAMDELAEFLEQQFPQIADEISVEALSDDEIVVRRRIQDEHLRPGGTVSGPTMFGLADVAVYLGILARIGPRALAVTTNGSIDFIRKPKAARDLICNCRILKLGRVLAVGDCLIYSDGAADPVARASMTYSIPPIEMKN